MDSQQSCDDLCKCHKIDSSLLNQEVSKDHLLEFALCVGEWEMLGEALNVQPGSIKAENLRYELQALRMLQKWQESWGPSATYRVLINALLKIRRTKTAHSVVRLVSRDKQPPHTTSQWTTPSSRVSVTKTVHTAQEKELLMKLNEVEEDFFNLVKNIEATLPDNKENVNAITRRFRMPSELLKWHHRNDENYVDTRQKIIESETVKQLLNNLATLKNWNYMVSADTLAYILKDINIQCMHQDIDEFREKLANFKRRTMLGDVMNLSFPIPNYFNQLTKDVEDWENKCIDEVEKTAMKKRQ